MTKCPIQHTKIINVSRGKGGKRTSPLGGWMKEGERKGGREGGREGGQTYLDKVSNPAGENYEGLKREGREGGRALGRLAVDEGGPGSVEEHDEDGS